MDATTSFLVQVTPRLLVILDPATPCAELGQWLRGFVTGGRRQVYLAVAAAMVPAPSEGRAEPPWSTPRGAREQAERRLLAERARLHGWGALAGGRVVDADAGRALLRLLRDGPTFARVLLATTTLREDRVRSLVRTVRRRHGIAVMVRDTLPSPTTRMQGAS